MKNLNVPLLLLLSLFSCTPKAINRNPHGGSANTAGYRADTLPAPFSTSSVKNFSEVVGWKEGQTPVAPAGFRVSKFADGLEHPRWIYAAENGDVFVAESNTILKGVLKAGSKISRKIKTEHIGDSPNKIILFRDSDHNGIPEKRYVFAENLNQPFGMLIVGNHFYVGNTDGLLQFNYTPGDTVLHGNGKKMLSLPAGKHNRHWTRNLITNAKKDKIYIGVGSGTNIAENGLDNEIRRADILEVNLDGSGERIYASGLRNPVGMDFAPGTQTLWAAVNERDELGDELVPDYLTGVKPGGFYGWPFYYYGQHKDPRVKASPAQPAISQVITPDVALGSHTASLGLVFYQGSLFPEKYHNGAFITQHGSWNRTIISGYKVIFVPFQNGKPAGKPEDFLTGFVEDASKSKVHGRPVGIALLQDGSLLISDDSSNTIWRVATDK